MATHLVTGGAGFIGSHIATGLVERGHKVRVLDNLSMGNIHNLDHIQNEIEFIEGDITNLDDVEKAVKGVEVIFHKAALPSVPLSIENPLASHAACATGTINVLDAARRNDVRRVVYAASSSAYGNHPEMPKTEQHLPETLSPYAAAKLAGEYYCECFSTTYGLETVRLRYFNVFGPRQDPKSPYSAVIPLFATAVIEGRQPKIFGDGLQSRDFVFVENVVQANLKAAEAQGVSGKVYNVACGTATNLIELLQEICRILGKPYNPIFEAERPGEVKHSWADISATISDLGYEPKVDVKQGLEKTIEFYLAQNKSETPSCV